MSQKLEAIKVELESRDEKVEVLQRQLHQERLLKGQAVTKLASHEQTLQEREESLVKQLESTNKEMSQRLDAIKSELDSRDEKLDQIQRQLQQEKLLKDQAVNKLAEIQLSDQLELETEQHFVSLYKNQLKEMKEEMEEKQKELNQTRHSLELTVSKLQAEITAKDVKNNEKFELLQRQLNQEKLLKLQAVNKLAEIMYRKDPKKSNKENSYELRKREKECRKLQQNLTTERERFDQTVARLQKNLSETQAALHDEGQSKLRLEMELEELKKKLQKQKNQQQSHPGLDGTTALANNSVTQDGDTSKPVDKPKNRRQRWLMRI